MYGSKTVLVVLVVYVSSRGLLVVLVSYATTFHLEMRPLILLNPNLATTEYYLILLKTESKLRSKNESE